MVGQVGTLRYQGARKKEDGQETVKTLGNFNNPVDFEPLASLVCTGQMECGTALLGICVSSLWVPTMPCSALGEPEAAISVCDLQ